MHHNTRTYQILMLLFTVRWYWKVWWDAGRLIVTGERDEEVTTIAVWFLIPKMKESEGTLDLNVLDFFWQLDYMCLIWSILKVRLIHWCLQPRTRCSGTTSKGEWQLKPESCANLRRKKITWGSSIKTIPSLAFCRESIIKVIKVRAFLKTHRALFRAFRSAPRHDDTMRRD